MSMTESASPTRVRHEHLLIGPDWCNAQSGQRFEVLNPATGERVGTVPDGGEAEVQAAITAASSAFDRWKRTPAIDRGRVLRRAADLLRERSSTIAALLTSEQGKSVSTTARRLYRARRSAA